MRNRWALFSSLLHNISAFLVNKFGIRDEIEAWTVFGTYTASNLHMKQGEHRLHIYRAVRLPNLIYFDKLPRLKEIERKGGNRW